MLSKRLGRIGRSLFQVIGKPQLLTQSFAGFDSVRLFSFRLPNASRGFKQLLHRIGRDENASIIIREYDVAARDFELAEASD